MKGQDSFNELMLRYRCLIFSVCRRYSRDGLSVDDLLQETTLAIWNRRDKMSAITSPPKQAVWIWRVVRSVAVAARYWRQWPSWPWPPLRYIYNNSSYSVVDSLGVSGYPSDATVAMPMVIHDLHQYTGCASQYVLNRIN